MKAEPNVLVLLFIRSTEKVTIVSEEKVRDYGCSPSHLDTVNITSFLQRVKHAGESLCAQNKQIGREGVPLA